MLGLSQLDSPVDYRIVMNAPSKDRKSFAWSIKRLTDGNDKAPNTEIHMEPREFPEDIKAWFRSGMNVEIVKSSWVKVSASPALNIIGGKHVKLSRAAFQHEIVYKSSKDLEKNAKKRQLKAMVAAKHTQEQLEANQLIARKKARIESGLAMDDEEDLVAQQLNGLSVKQRKTFHDRVATAVLK